MATYSLTTIWYLDAPIIRVFDTLGEVPRWPDWWPSLIAVKERDLGADDGTGRVYHYTWRSRLGYRLCFDIRVTRVIRPWLIEGVASGDVCGVGRWRFSEQGGVTRVCHEWQVHTTRPWMNRVAALARPLFVWSHHAVMRDGAQGLARRLGGRLLSLVNE
ncbi:SRPBCC family protein [uncultured Halomonas sp.]|uniref:SRPBCC family protein n=1 Tax=uncultured Halomonas sp. TaxID=173971 RepID=UPI00260CDB07|nr:SRPBCC family protein [uncultured Halomonas sp.]